MTNISVNLKFFASMRDTIGARESKVTVPEGSSVGNVLELLKGRYPQLEKAFDCSVVAINEEYALKHILLNEGDTLAIIPPVSGGK